MIIDIWGVREVKGRKDEGKVATNTKVGETQLRLKCFI